MKEIELSWCFFFSFFLVRDSFFVKTLVRVFRWRDPFSTSMIMGGSLLEASCNHHGSDLIPSTSTFFFAYDSRPYEGQMIGFKISGMYGLLT